MSEFTEPQLERLLQEIGPRVVPKSYDLRIRYRLPYQVNVRDGGAELGRPFETDAWTRRSYHASLSN